MRGISEDGKLSQYSSCLNLTSNLSIGRDLLITTYIPSFLITSLFLTPDRYLHGIVGEVDNTSRHGAQYKSLFQESLAYSIMSSQFNEIADIPREFLREGTQFMNRCAKPDKREFIKISQAVGIGFVVMGAIGYVVKLIHIPVNNILVGGA
ncbi:MAG: hypothetical protein L6R35_000799 [Caloplaca aegaea]|nr:MAG: hypothetical protein L6R35_000799 [Caloplaca aegaea]